MSYRPWKYLNVFHYDQAPSYFCTKCDTFSVSAIFETNRSLVQSAMHLPHTWVVFFQIFAIKCTEKLFSFQFFQNVPISKNTSTNLIWPFPRRGPFAQLGILSTYRQNQFHTKSPWSKVLILTFLSYHRPTLALLASILMRAFSRCPAKSSNSSFISAA